MNEQPEEEPRRAFPDSRGEVKWASWRAAPGDPHVYWLAHGAISSRHPSPTWGVVIMDGFDVSVVEELEPLPPDQRTSEDGLRRWIAGIIGPEAARRLVESMARGWPQLVDDGRGGRETP